MMWKYTEKFHRTPTLAPLVSLIARAAINYRYFCSLFLRCSKHSVFPRLILFHTSGSHPHTHERTRTLTSAPRVVTVGDASARTNARKSKACSGSNPAANDDDEQKRARGDFERTTHDYNDNDERASQRFKDHESTKEQHQQITVPSPFPTVFQLFHGPSTVFGAARSVFSWPEQPWLSLWDAFEKKCCVVRTLSRASERYYVLGALMLGNPCWENEHYSLTAASFMNK